MLRMNMTKEKGMEWKRMRRMSRLRTMREHLLREKVQEVKRMVVPVPLSFPQYGSSMIFTRR